MSETAAIIIDNGSGVCKAGFAGEDVPHINFPNLVGVPKHTVSMVDPEQHPLPSTYIGHEAQENRGLLSMVYPISHGVVTDWDLMEKIWTYLFEDQLKVDPMDHSVMMTEAPLNPKKNREKMLEVLFDSFGVPEMYVAMGAVLSLYAAGRTTGVVLDVGDGITHTVPIYEGYTRTFAIGRLQMAGRDLTEYLTRLLHERGYLFESTAEQEIVRDMKEKLCYVALDYDEEMRQYDSNPAQVDREYELPDGTVLTLGSERFRCPELLFRPQIVGREQGGLPELLNRTIMKCGLDARRIHYNNIVVSGGTTLLPGFEDRVEKGVAKLAPDSAKVKVVTPEERKDSVWIGGSILASLSSFQDMWIGKLEYQEEGPSIVHKKCLYAS